MDNGAGLAKQCEVVKSRNPGTRCVVYRNTVIALNQYRHISKILDNPAYAGYFLGFKTGATQTGKCRMIWDPRGAQSPDHDPIWPTPTVCDAPLPTDVHVPMCDFADPGKCNRQLYFDQNQCPQVPGDNWSNDTTDVYQQLACFGKSCDCGASPCGEYLFDFRNASAVEWWLDEHMGGATGLGHPDVDGLILDDFWSNGVPSEIDSHAVQDMGLAPADTAAIEAAYGGAMVKLGEYIADHDKMLAGGRDCAYGGDFMSDKSPATCLQKLTSMCDGHGHNAGQWYGVNYNYIPAPAYGVAAQNAPLDVAYFLLTRAPLAWIGGGGMFGWRMSHW